MPASHIIITLMLLSLMAEFAVSQYPGYSVLVQIPAQGRESALVDGLEVSEMRATRGPCECLDGLCSCCTGVTLQQFNQKGCLKLAYDPDDFAISVGISMNDKMVYKNSVSGKNPKPICVPMGRFSSLQLCVKFTNVFLAGRNIHACVDMEGQLFDSSLFNLKFDCMRLGANGVALLKPEDGGGLPAAQGGEDDYDNVDEGPDYDVEGVGGPEDETPSVISNVTKTQKKPSALPQTTPHVVVSSASTTVTPVKVTTVTNTQDKVVSVTAKVAVAATGAEITTAAAAPLNPPSSSLNNLSP